MFIVPVIISVGIRVKSSTLEFWPALLLLPPLLPALLSPLLSPLLPAPTVVLPAGHCLLVGVEEDVLLLEGEFAGAEFLFLRFDPAVNLSGGRGTRWKTERALYLWMPARLMMSMRSTEEN
jgi:hypothetical protein